MRILFVESRKADAVKLYRKNDLFPKTKTGREWILQTCTSQRARYAVWYHPLSV